MNWRVITDKWLAVSIRRNLLDLDLEVLKEQMGGEVLEIGAGKAGRRGEFRPPVNESEHWVYLNLSRSPLPDIQADVSYLPLAQQRFDTIVCLEVFEYVPDPARALQEIRRTLKTNGTLILSIPFVHRQDTQDDYWRFTESGAAFLLKQAGFQITTLKAQGAALAVAVSILKFVIHARNDKFRLLIGRLARPVLNSLWKRDNISSEKSPALLSFSTGFLITARPILDT